MVLFSGCANNSVTKQQLEKVKPGDVLIYRYKKSDGKTWFYNDKVTRIEGNIIFYTPSKNEATAGHDYRLGEFLTDQEIKMNKDDLLKYLTELQSRVEVQTKNRTLMFRMIRINIGFNLSCWLRSSGE